MADTQKDTVRSRAEERLRLDAKLLETLRPYQLEMIPNVLADIRREADEYVLMTR